MNKNYQRTLEKEAKTSFSRSPGNDANLNIPALFEQRGIRWTPQRQLVMDTFQKRSGHISAEEVHTEIVKVFPRVNLSTVYRTLELLCDLGVAVEVEPGKDDDRRRYELVEGTPHYHLICEVCNGEMELAPEVISHLQAEIKERYDFQLRLPHFVGVGRCARCEARAN
ncbi:MAG TPA: transcriptional repressor [Chloroflexia bacterium]|nr:transcriptional repressor [Chloroflexia bacterium]